LPDDVEVIVGELAPLLFDLAFDLFPISLDSIPIHVRLRVLVQQRRLNGAVPAAPKCREKNAQPLGLTTGAFGERSGLLTGTMRLAALG
jgi:hypothetical protein